LTVAATEARGARISAWFRSSALFFIIALAIAGSFWIVPILTAPDKSPEGLLLFREAGDPGYFPEVAWISHFEFGETTVKEYAGTGVRSFPFVPFTLHAILYRVAGSVGFIAADILIVVLYAFVLRQLLLLGGVGRWPAALLSLAAISSAAQTIKNAASAVSHHSIPLMFWEFRFPRPSITESIFLLVLILSILLIARPQRPIWFFILYGLGFGAILQSDIFAAFNAALVVGAVLIYVVAVSKDWWATAKRLLAAAVTMGLAGTPFMYQQLHTSADVKRRFGVFSTDRYSALLPGLNIIAFSLILFVVAIALALFYARRDRKKGRLAALSVVATAMATSIFSAALWCAVLHKTIQPYHFNFQAMQVIGYLVLLYVGWLLTDLRELSPLRKMHENRWTLMSATAGVAFAAFCLLSAYRSSVHRNNGDLHGPVHRDNGNLPTSNPLLDNFNLVHYRTDFAELHRVLDRPEYVSATVLGTFDIQLDNWWLYRRGYLYLVEPFHSTLPDSVMEARAFEFLRRVGTSNEDFGHLLDNNYFLVQILGGDKYQAYSLHTTWPLSDYSPDAQQRIVSESWPHHLEVPLSERSRLMQAYAQTDGIQEPANALDVIVFNKDSLRPYVHPERGDRFHLVMSNQTFELWVPNAR